jgi:hypothetical protein
LITMRTDLFQDRKCIHVKLDKDVHAALRAQLFKHNLSMQEVFDEFAKLFVTDDVRASRIVESLVMRKITEALEGTKKSKKAKKRSDRKINELDHDSLYHLIDSQTEVVET